MRSRAGGVPDPGGRAESPTLTIARVLVAAALALLAAGAAFMFLYGVVLVSEPDDGETTYPNYGAVLLALAGVVVSSCIAIWGLGRAAPRTVLAGAAGVAAGAAILMVAAETVGPSGYYRALFVLVLGLVGAAALVGRRLRRAPRPI